jgi:hypothetical protein
MESLTLMGGAEQRGKDCTPDTHMRGMLKPVLYQYLQYGDFTV